jgi:metallo-beta-lactamase class B
MSSSMSMTSKLALGAMVACLAAAPLFAQKLVPMTAEETNLRNVGTPGHPGTNAEKDEPAPPHKIIGNLYYVGTTVHCNYLIVTPAGDILINTGYERTWPMTQASIEKLGFKVSDIKIILGSHAHIDHQQADAMVKQLTGAPVEVMEQDIPLLQKLTPGGKPHPIDKILHDGDTVSLDGSTWVAHLTAGHTPGCTTWTSKIADGGKTYNVVIMCGGGAGKLVNNPDEPNVVDDFHKTFAFLKSVPCDIPLGSHTDHYNENEKYAEMMKNPKGPNPFIDEGGCAVEGGNWEAVFNDALAKQMKEAAGAGPSASN